MLHPPTALTHSPAIVSSQVLRANSVGITAGLCSLITGMTSGAGYPTFGCSLAIELEKLCVYSLVWSVGGFLEFDDRLANG